jgi:hypothetical protein
MMPNGTHCINHSLQNRPTAKHSGLQLLEIVGQKPLLATSSGDFDEIDAGRNSDSAEMA